MQATPASKEEAQKVRQLNSLLYYVQLLCTAAHLMKLKV